MTFSGSMLGLTTTRAWVLVAVVTGKNGDMDTVGWRLRSLQPIPTCWLWYPHRPGGGTVCRQAPGASNLEEGHTSWPKQLAAVVVVDAAAPDQTGLSLPSVPLCVIDHHATDAWELGER